MSTQVRFAPAVRTLLTEALVEERALLEALRGARGERLAEPPGAVRYRCSLPVRRPLDPEFVQVVEVQVTLHPASDGAWELVEVDGLETPETA